MSDKQFYILLGVGALALLFVSQKAKAVGRAINPNNPDNVFSEFADESTRTLAGEKNKLGTRQTFGGYLYEKRDEFGQYLNENFGGR